MSSTTTSRIFLHSFASLNNCAKKGRIFAILKAYIASKSSWLSPFSRSLLCLVSRPPAIVLYIQGLKLSFAVSPFDSKYRRGSRSVGRSTSPIPPDASRRVGAKGAINYDLVTERGRPKGKEDLLRNYEE